jgi:hypothetical protein
MWRIKSGSLKTQQHPDVSTRVEFLEVCYLDVRAVRRDAERSDSDTMIVMSRRDGLTDMADNADEIAAFWYTPNPPPCPTLPISHHAPPS